MTIGEILNAAFSLGILALLGCILLELRDQRVTRRLRESTRRRDYVREEHREG